MINFFSIIKDQFEDQLFMIAKTYGYKNFFFIKSPT